jgi:hypothetical protein
MDGGCLLLAAGVESCQPRNAEMKSVTAVAKHVPLDEVSLGAWRNEMKIGGFLLRKCAQLKRNIARRNVKVSRGTHCQLSHVWCAASVLCEVIFRDSTIDGICSHFTRSPSRSHSRSLDHDNEAAESVKSFDMRKMTPRKSI